jgi:hypothetical protein
MVFAQKFYKHESVSEPLCISVDDLDSSPIFGTELQNNNDDIDFTEILPASKNIGIFALKNMTELMEKDLGKISPFYLTEFNISKLR